MDSIKSILNDTELWPSLDTIDGQSCLTYKSCEIRLSGQWCPYDQATLLRKLADPARFNPTDYKNVTFGECGGLFKSIKNLTERIIKESRIDRPPVPNTLVHEIIPEDELIIACLPLQVFHGALWCLKHEIFIFLNENDPDSVHRISLFHELFHGLTYLYTGWKAGSVSTKRGLFIELLAGYFASAILMPEWLVTERWRSLQDEESIAQEFQVPLPVMSIRLRRLGLI